MHIEIDVSGADLFHENYTICISNGEGFIRGYKFTKNVIEELKENYFRNKYTRLQKNIRIGKFKVKIYLIVLRYLFQDFFNQCPEEDFTITFCRDFPFHENSISCSIRHQLKNVHCKNLKKINCEKLPIFSDAHCYAKMMHHDRHNYLNCYCNINLEDIEKFLILKK